MSASSYRRLHPAGSCSLLFAVCLLTQLLSCTCNGAEALTGDLIPHPCAAVKCPPLEQITCPEDSDERDNIRSAASLTTAQVDDSYNSTEIADDLYAQCCVAMKCICKTCYIPDCHTEGEVVVELLSESMDTPGHCCGLYECRKEPNCTEVRDTESYWLTDCQRCKCYASERICHQSCDEGLKKPTALCNSKSLNKFFPHGDTWHDGCYECECVNGEEKCVLPFCKSLNCPPHRQVMLKNSCCPICWPKGYDMPIGEVDYDDDESVGEQAAAAGDAIDHNYDSGEDDSLEPLPSATNSYGEHDINTLPNIDFSKELDTRVATTERSNITNTTTLGTTAASTITSIVASMQANTSTSAPNVKANTNSNSNSVSPTTNAPTPCIRDPSGQDASAATYQVYPEVVEVVRQTHQNDLLYAVIGCLALVIVILSAYNIHLRGKQRSYRPVSNFDDNFNKMSSNIKKMNDYV